MKTLKVYWDVLGLIFNDAWKELKDNRPGKMIIFLGGVGTVLFIAYVLFDSIERGMAKTEIINNLEVTNMRFKAADSYNTYDEKGRAAHHTTPPRYYIQVEYQGRLYWCKADPRQYNDYRPGDKVGAKIGVMPIRGKTFCKSIWGWG